MRSMVAPDAAQAVASGRTFDRPGTGPGRMTFAAIANSHHCHVSSSVMNSSMTTSATRTKALPKICLTISQLMAHALPRWGISGDVIPFIREIWSV
jgi:hypothetical protein